MFGKRTHQALLVALIAIGALHVSAATTTELEDARLRTEEARSTLNQSSASLEDVEARLAAIKEKLVSAYRVLDVEVRDRDTAGEADSRSDIERLQENKLQLAAERERARITVARHDAELEAEEAMLRIVELRLTSEPAAAEIKRLQRKHDKAMSQARAMARRLEALP